MSNETATLVKLSAAEQAAAVKKGDVTSRELVEAHLKVIEAARFAAAIAGPDALAQVGPGATIDDAVRAAEALDAMTASVREGRWVSPAPVEAVSSAS